MLMLSVGDHILRTTGIEKIEMRAEQEIVCEEMVIGIWKSITDLLVNLKLSF